MIKRQYICISQFVCIWQYVCGPLKWFQWWNGRDHSCNSSICFQLNIQKTSHQWSFNYVPTKPPHKVESSDNELYKILILLDDDEIDNEARSINKKTFFFNNAIHRMLQRREQIDEDVAAGKEYLMMLLIWFGINIFSRSKLGLKTGKERKGQLTYNHRGKYAHERRTWNQMRNKASVWMRRSRMKQVGGSCSRLTLIRAKNGVILG